MQQQEKHKLANSSDSTLYDRHAAVILAYARSHTASWQDAEDLTLEVFLAALLESLYEAVGKLSLEQRQVLQLRFGEGLRFAEIAILLNKHEASVRKICSRSLALLRGIYHKH